MRISDWSSDVCSSDLLAVCSIWCMTGPAQKAKATVASISKPTGAASLIRRRGETVSSELQNRRMPLRPRADRKSDVSGQSVSVRVARGGRRVSNKKQEKTIARKHEA